MRIAVRILIGLLLALAIEHARPGIMARVGTIGSANFAMAQVPANYYPPGYDPSVPPGYVDPSAQNGAGEFPVNNYGPSAPSSPTNPTRPPSWPGGPPAAAAAQLPGGIAPPPAAAQAEPAAMRDPTEPPVEPAAILAHVGSEVVQAADILPTVNEMLNAHLEKIADQLATVPEDFKTKQIAQWRREVVQQVLKDTINIKLLMADIKSSAPKEGVEKNVEHMRKAFNDSEIRRLKGVYKAHSIADLENKLRAQGGSLESQRMAFVERNMAIGWVMSQV